MDDSAINENRGISFGKYGCQSDKWKYADKYC